MDNLYPAVIFRLIRSIIIYIEIIDGTVRAGVRKTGFRRRFPIRLGVLLPRRNSKNRLGDKMNLTMRIASIALLVVGTSALASAAVPEIDPGTGMNVLALLGGAAIVIRASLKK